VERLREKGKVKWRGYERRGQERRGLVKRGGLVIGRNQTASIWPAILWVWLTLIHDFIQRGEVGSQYVHTSTEISHHRLHLRR
jgi:hypothetical protein